MELFQEFFGDRRTSFDNFRHNPFIIASRLTCFFILNGKSTDIVAFHEMLKNFDLVQPQVLFQLAIFVAVWILVLMRLCFFDGEQRLELVELLLDYKFGNHVFLVKVAFGLLLLYTIPIIIQLYLDCIDLQLDSVVSPRLLLPHLFGLFAVPTSQNEYIGGKVEI